MVFSLKEWRRSRRGVYSIPYISEIVSPIADEYGVSQVYIFGSYAKGIATKDSDIDLFIVPGRMRGMAIGGFRQDLCYAFDRNVDVVTNNADPRFIDLISKDLVQIYGY